MKTKAVPKPEVEPENQVKQDLEKVEADLTEESLVHLEPAVLVVRRQFKEQGEFVVDPEEETEEIAVQDFYTDPARVHLRVNHTNNMGNYWSMSVQVGIDVPCYREEYNEAFDFAAKTVAERLVVEIEKAKERVEVMRKTKGTGANLF